MKRYFSILIMVLAWCLPAFAGGDGAQISFDTKIYDFGTIQARKGIVKAAYTFTNTGTEPLVIVSVSNGGCGCTKPDYPKQPIAPGKMGNIVINFNPAGRKGEFKREVKVKTNAKNGRRQSLIFTGVIIP